jgi:hypothetical protein
VLTKLQAFSSWKSVPTILLDPDGHEESDLLQIRNIDGLDPIKATVSTSPFGSIDGTSFTGSRVDNRNIVLTVHPNPDWHDWTNESLRKLLYRYFMPKSLTRLVFYSDDISPVEIFGYVENLEANPFAKDLEYQVSIICPDPYFTAVNPTVLTGVSGSWSTITYTGDVDTGFTLTISRAQDPNPSYIEINIEGAIFWVNPATVDTSKFFSMNSIPGQKFVRNVSTPGGLITNLLSEVVAGSPWPRLVPGDNSFLVNTDTHNEDWELTYYERYGGL